MLHVRYMTTMVPICEDPDALDEVGDFVVQDSSSNPEPSCRECYSALAMHNKRAYEREEFEHLKVKREPNLVTDPSVDIFIGGLALGSAFWITVLVIVWAVFLRCG